MEMMEREKCLLGAGAVFGMMPGGVVSSRSADTGVATEFGNYRTLGQCHWNVTVS